MATDFTIGELDPAESVNNPVRSLAGPSKVRAVTFGTDFGEFATWLYVGVTCDLTYIDWTDTSVTLTNLLGGTFHPIHAKQIVSVSVGAASDFKWGS